MKDLNYKRVVKCPYDVDNVFKLTSLGVVTVITVAILAINPRFKWLQSNVDTLTYNSWQIQSKETKNLLLQFQYVLMYDDTSVGGSSETESLRSSYTQFVSLYVDHPVTEIENLQNTFILLELVKIKLNFFKTGLAVYKTLTFNSCKVSETIKSFVYYA